jgi:wyosine [tRNA(Phe)-imidazoG37] synthetase (radical SAM superfamily)
VSTILFDKLVFGPVYSRRLGTSLGINLLPLDSKFCNFDCIYCECGWSKSSSEIKLKLPERAVLKKLLAEKLQQLRGTVNEPDAITFAGNGEPTIHPDFPGIIDDTIEVRDSYSPHSQISVLSNASMIHKRDIRKALSKVDKNILKLDTGIDRTFELLNRSAGERSINEIVRNLMLFKGKLIIQTLFVRGHFNGHVIDNTTPEEIDAWLPLIKKINPEYVMIYPIDRGTPVKDLEKIPEEELRSIARLVEEAGIKTEVYY